nr:C-GCAxxG-C-C family (seleno)protein [Candidatus Freyarchaeota archaeon]
MTEKFEMKNKLMDEAYQRAHDYMVKWLGCAPAVFAAVMDTLGYENDHVINEAWKTTLGLVGGTGEMAIGTCGAFAGAAAAISYSFGVTKEDLEKDRMKIFKINGAVAEVGKEMQEKYGHITCQEVQFHHWGISYRFTNPNGRSEFAKRWMKTQQDFECQKLSGDLARWAVEKILEYNPLFSKRK